MYNLETLLKIKELGLSVRYYLLLKLVEDNALFNFREEYLDILVDCKTQGLLTNTEELTTKGYEILKEIEGKNDTKSINYPLLHKKLQDELFRLTGERQYRVDGKYSFFPNLKDFTDKTKKVVLKYKLKDYNKIETILLNHIRKAVKANFKYIPLLGYYISKDGKSMLVDDYENYDGKENTTIQANHNTSTPINTFDI
jgi:hypothetical protein